MDIYLAAAYQRRTEMRGVRSVLQAMGHRVTATWIDDEGPIEGFSTAQLQLADGVQHGQALAWRDIRDLHKAATLISFTDGAPARGGRHVEFGMAYAWGKRLIVVGPREHVFHALPLVEHYPDWAALANEMAVWAVDMREQRRA